MSAMSDHMMELEQKFKNRNLLEELAYYAAYPPKGYVPKVEVDLIQWAMYKAYQIIKGKPTMNSCDCISREAAIDVLCAACGNAACPKGMIPRCSYYDKMQAIPPAEGRLVVLPCKVGDAVYWNTGLEIVEARVADFIIDGAMQLRLNLPTLDITPVYPHDRLYLTRQEAEAALKDAGWFTVDPSLGGNFRKPKD
jgi:hypothetical protein